jgi:hypothetical protein
MLETERWAEYGESSDQVRTENRIKGRAEIFHLEEPRGRMTQVYFETHQGPGDAR